MSLIDPKRLVEIYDDNDAFKQKMFGMFIDKAPETIQQFEESLKNRNQDRIAGLAHKYRSSLDFVACPQLDEIAKNIELEAKENVPIEDLSPMIETLIKKTYALLDELNSHLK
ncbi:MAG: Hpt domain-containing protein [Flavobacteriales bacterium]|nr:Hpt domain-containing protein [Flavobacteriales bacterium]